MISQRFEGYEWESGISLYKLNVTWNYGITVLLNKIISFKFYLIILNSGSTISVTILQVSNPVWYVGNPDKATVDLTSGDPTHLFKNGWLFSHWVPLNWYLGFLFDNEYFKLRQNLFQFKKSISYSLLLRHRFKGYQVKENERGIGWNLRVSDVPVSRNWYKTVSKLYQNVYI